MVEYFIFVRKVLLTITHPVMIILLLSMILLIPMVIIVLRKLKKLKEFEYRVQENHLIYISKNDKNESYFIWQFEASLIDSRSAWWYRSYKI